MDGFLAGQMKPEILTGFGRLVHDPGQKGGAPWCRIYDASLGDWKEDSHGIH
jgi:hypothetical protein